MKSNCGWIDDQHTIRLKIAELDGKPSSFPTIKCNHQVFTVNSIAWEQGTATITLEEILPLGKDISLSWADVHVPVYPGKIVLTEWFENQYDATNKPLGCFYTPKKTSFAVWAPTATKIELVLEEKQFTMTRTSKGVWQTTVSGNCHLSRYYFLVTINGTEQHINDPYAKALTANCKRGVVIDLKQTEPGGFRMVNYPKIARKDAIIYELHVRDATSAVSSGVVHRGKYLGLTERKTKTLNGHSTGLSYISELGVTHIQLLPLQDFARVDELQPEDSYNWGYDPLYYFTPEGSYSTDANNPIARILECKQMIQAIHEEGMSVILDVVYNHVYDYEASVFERLVPGYFFRHHPTGEMSNATGTGNDLATERKMVRKLILDCIDYWLTEYQVDGFRFDLMGVMDVDTMQMIRERSEQEDRPILLLGEGWELDTPLPPEQKASLAQAEQLLGISFFNDRFRDSIKGNLFDVRNLGYTNGNGHFFERMAQLVAGSCQLRFGEKLFSDPLQSVNYVECHDNHTLWDRLVLSNPEATELERKQMHQLATGLTLVSQGIPFLHAGQEFFRTKQGDENSYISGDEINQLDWELRGKENRNVQWLRRLIELRKNYPLFRLGDSVEIENRLHIVHTPEPVLGFLLAGTHEDLVVFANPTNQALKVTMPALGLWEKQLSNHSAEISPISCLLEPTTEIAAYELVIFKKDRT